jgi:hypothetical protein
MRGAIRWARPVLEIRARTLPGACRSDRPRDCRKGILESGAGCGLRCANAHDATTAMVVAAVLGGCPLARYLGRDDRGRDWPALSFSSEGKDRPGSEV